MKCPYCGNEITELSPFSMCPFCGQPIESRYTDGPIERYPYKVPGISTDFDVTLRSWKE